MDTPANATWQAKSVAVAASGSLLPRSRSESVHVTVFTLRHAHLAMVDYGQSSSGVYSSSPLRFEPISLDEEARLYSTNAERERYGMLATLFGVIVALDYLERAYVRDSVPAAE